MLAYNHFTKRQWFTRFSDGAYLGCAPVACVGHVDTLQDLGVTGVVNLCDEYDGPQAAYDTRGITQLRLPVIDHCEPTVTDIEKAMLFLKEHRRAGGAVFIHCKGGHGRSAAVALCWLVFHDGLSPDEAQRQLLSVRYTSRNTIYDTHSLLQYP